MDRSYYINLYEQSLNGITLSQEDCRRILNDQNLEILPLLDAAYQLRKKYTGKEVAIHIINNAQNGFCPEDCHYCPQAKSSQADIEEYPLKPDHEILAEAKRAHESGAFRYCMVFAGRGPSQKRVDHLSRLITEIKNRYPIQICVSAGLINDAAAQQLKAAGLDRLNHNLNTSKEHYPKICTTHTYEDRLNTLNAAVKAGLEICSGMIVGMGEKSEDVIEVALKLRELKSPSIPVNFLVPIEGNALSQANGLTPEYCLRVLCLYRFLNPTAEIRVAAGREGHLRGMEVMSLYPANSLFLEGYLNTKGSSRAKTLQMIKDAGFTIKSDIPLEELLEEETNNSAAFQITGSDRLLKDLKELRPQLEQQAATESKT